MISLTTTFVILKAVLVIGVLPIVIWFYTEKGKNKQAANGVAKAWFFKNFYFYIMLILVGFAVFAEVRTNHTPENQHGQERELEFFRMDAYRNELNQHIPPATNTDWSNQKQQLLRKFDYAQYLWDSKDYKRALEALSSLEAGQDQVGSLEKVPSFVIDNDLGCVYFKLQRNRSFSAFTFFQNARNLADSEHRNSIEENLRKLDDMVNAID
jgi:heme/copper-type cytochrome/quinol oxidase subunit 2